MSDSPRARRDGWQTRRAWTSALSARFKRFLQLHVLGNARQRELLRLKALDYASVPLAPSSEEAIQTVQRHAGAIHQGSEYGWNFYSNALRREVVETFERAVGDVSARFGTVDFVEIGSAQGLSMSVIGLLLKARGALGRLISVDPYFETGYFEGAKGVWEKDTYVGITKRTKALAFKLYQAVGLDVESLELSSLEGLRRLYQEDRQFHLVYIDGSHEGLNPLLDFGLSCALLHPGGVVMLDDHHWPDIELVKRLCDKHCVKVHECWKVAAYRVDGERVRRGDGNIGSTGAGWRASTPGTRHHLDG